MLPPPLLALHARSPLSPRVLVIASGMSAGVHRIFNEILVREQNADLTIAGHLAIAEGSAVLTVDVQALDLLQLLFAADGFAGLFQDFLRARVCECCGRAEENECE